MASRPLSSMASRADRASSGEAPRTGLHHHHADVVRHHVVQLAGDARPLVPDGLAGGVRLLFGEPEQPCL